MAAVSLPDFLMTIFVVIVSAALSWDCQETQRALGEEIAFMKVRDTLERFVQIVGPRLTVHVTSECNHIIHYI
jgi:hypothetical protein